MEVECVTTNLQWTEEETVRPRPLVAAIRIEVSLENGEALPDFLRQITANKKTLTDNVDTINCFFPPILIMV